MTTHGAASSRIGILFALPEEAAPFQHLLNNPSQWNVNLTVAVSGVGAKNSAEAVEKLLATPGLPFEFILLCGFGGGLHPSLQYNAIAIASSVITYRERKIVNEVKANADALQTFFHSPMSPENLGKLVSSDCVLVTQVDKEIVEAQTGGLFVDMESAGAVEVLEKAGVPWVALRVITDTSLVDLPLDFNQFAKVDGNPDVRKIVLHVLRHPRLIPALLSFGRKTRMSAVYLAFFLERYFKHRFEPEEKAERR